MSFRPQGRFNVSENIPVVHLQAWSIMTYWADFTRTAVNSKENLLQKNGTNCFLQFYNFNKPYLWLVAALPSQTFCENSNWVRLLWSQTKPKRAWHHSVRNQKKWYIYLFFNEILENKTKKLFWLYISQMTNWTMNIIFMCDVILFCFSQPFCGKGKCWTGKMAFLRLAAAHSTQNRGTRGVKYLQTLNYCGNY